MKTHQIEIQKFKAAANSPHGEVMFKVDVLASTRAASPDDVSPSSMLIMNEANARVLMVLLKKQLAEFDAKKPKSRHGRPG